MGILDITRQLRAALYQPAQDDGIHFDRLNKRRIRVQ
jgi:hypothetical protein